MVQTEKPWGWILKEDGHFICFAKTTNKLIDTTFVKSNISNSKVSLIKLLNPSRVMNIIVAIRNERH